MRSSGWRRTTVRYYETLCCPGDLVHALNMRVNGKQPSEGPDHLVFVFVLSCSQLWDHLGSFEILTTYAPACSPPPMKSNSLEESWLWCFLKSSPDDFNMRPGLRGSLVAQTVKNPSAVQETRVRSLGQEDPLEEGMATHFSVLVWRIPWTEEPGGI